MTAAADFHIVCFEHADTNAQQPSQLFFIVSLLTRMPSIDSELICSFSLLCCTLASDYFVVMTTAADLLFLIWQSRRSYCQNFDWQSRRSYCQNFAWQNRRSYCHNFA